MNNQAEKFKTSDNKKVSIEDKKADRCWRRWRSGQCPFAPMVVQQRLIRRMCMRNIIPRGRRQTNWLTKTISSSGNPSFNSACAETLIREFTSNAFSEGQVHHLYLIYLTCCKYCWSFPVDLVRPHFSEVHPRIKLPSAAAERRRSGVHANHRYLRSALEQSLRSCCISTLFLFCSFVSEGFFFFNYLFFAPPALCLL